MTVELQLREGGNDYKINKCRRGSGSTQTCLFLPLHNRKVAYATLIGSH